MLDEGVGVRVMEELHQHYTFDDMTDLIDAGTMGLGMITIFRGLGFLLIIDAINGTGYPAGTVVRVSPEDFAPNQVMHSLHDIRFVDVLQAAQLIGIEVEAECVGIQIENMSPSELTIGLTEAVEQAIPRAMAAALTLLDERSIPFEVIEPETAEDRELIDAVNDAYEEMKDKRRS